MPLGSHGDFAGGEGLGQSVPIPGGASRRRLLQQLVVKFGRLKGFFGGHRRFSGIARPDRAHILFLEIISPVGGQNVAEIAHQ